MNASLEIEVEPLHDMASAGSGTWDRDLAGFFRHAGRAGPGQQYHFIEEAAS
jgi:hypothetical protein